MARGQCGHTLGLVGIECRRCRRWFFRCCRCYHGHRYCTKRCQKTARKAQQDAARKRHINKDPEAARAANTERQRDCRRRARGVGQQGGAACEKAQQPQHDEETVTDQGPNPSDPPLSPSVDEAHRSARPQRSRHTGRPRGQKRCQGCGRWGRVVLWVRRCDKTPSFRRLL